MVTARENEKTMAFLVAFDNWVTAKDGGVTGSVHDMLWGEVRRTFGNLPLWIQRTLPSFKALAMRV
jgi:hypothetical protein